MILAVHPGEVLEEALAERSMSQTEFARRMGLTPKHVNRIIRGRAGFTPGVALGMERVLGISARLWLNLQSDYRLAVLRGAMTPTRLPTRETRHAHAEHDPRSRCAFGRSTPDGTAGPRGVPFRLPPSVK
jgi:addiction module HigA family antidote